MPPVTITVIKLPLWGSCIGATANHIRPAQFKLIPIYDFLDFGLTHLVANQGKQIFF
jgi:hypothetical protein